MDYNNHNDRDRDVNGRYTHDHNVGKKSGIGIGAIILIAALAIAAYFLFNGRDDNASTIERDGRGAVGAVERGADRLGDKISDAAKEVPQAAKDATTDGDQKTTRPNDPDSTEKLDQK